MRNLNRELLFGDVDGTNEDSSQVAAKVLAFETELNSGDTHPIFDRNGAIIMKTIRDVPLKKLVVGYDDEIVAVKVYDSVIRGAEEQEGLWANIARVVPMTTEIERVPVFTPDDFKFYPWVRGTGARSSGGSIWQVELDCSDDTGLYAADIGLPKGFAERKGFDAMEEALWAVGQAAGRKLIAAVVAELTTDVNAAMTNAMANWGNSQYKSLVKMESLIANVGMNGTMCLINPAEGYDLGILEQLISVDYALFARAIPKDVHSIGHLFGRIPIIRHRDMTAASMLMMDSQKAAILGIYQELTIENYVDVREGMEGALAVMQYDIKSGKDASGPSGATSPLAKSWAVTTTA